MKDCFVLAATCHSSDSCRGCSQILARCEVLCCGSDPSDTSHHGSQLLLFAEEDRRNMMGIESLQKAQMHKYYIFILNICVSAEKKGSRSHT